MDPLFQDERISAYLDGQMPPDERSQFEDEMARSGELRQVVEELRGLHESLQALPRQRLGDDFSQHVLRRAERAMLTDSRVAAPPSGANAENGAGESAVEKSPVVRAAISETGKSRRPWIWAAIAIAVAVMLMVLNPPPNKHDKVAQSDSAPRSQAARRADSLAGDAQLHKPEQPPHEPRFSAPAGGIATNGEIAKRAVELKLKTNESAPAQAADEPERLHSIVGQDGTNGEADLAAQSTATPATGSNRRGELAKSAAPAAPATTPSPAATNEKATDEKATGAGGRLTQQGNVESRQNGAPSAIAPGGAAGAQPQLFAGSANQPAGRGSAGAGKAEEAARGPIGGFAESRERSLPARSFGYAQGKEGKRELPAGEMIVAEVETRSEVSPAKLQQLLDKRGITLNNSPAALTALMGAVRKASEMDFAAVSGSSASKGAAVADAAAKDAAKAGADDTRAVAKNANPAPAKPISRPEAPSPTAALKFADSDHEAQETEADKESLEVVYVVGTRQQVLGLVADLRSQPEQYRTLGLTTMSPEATDGEKGWLEKDAKAPASRLAVDDVTAGAKTDRDGEGVRAARKLPGASAPAPSLPAAPPALSDLAETAAPREQKPNATAKPEPAAADGGKSPGIDAPATVKKENADRRAGGEGAADKPAAVPAPAAAPMILEQKTVERAPAAEPPSPVALDVEGAAEPVERSSGSGWAARMPLQPEAENLLRKSLAEREKQPPADKAKLDSQWKQLATQRDSLGRSEGGVGGGAPDDPVQAVLVFRLAPAKAKPAVAAPGK